MPEKSKPFRIRQKYHFLLRNIAIVYWTNTVKNFFTGMGIVDFSEKIYILLSWKIIWKIYLRIAPALITVVCNARSIKNSFSRMGITLNFIDGSWLSRSGINVHFESVKICRGFYENNSSEVHIFTIWT